MKQGRTIVVEINIDGETWKQNFDAELGALTSHIEASVHMWDETNWQPKLLLGTDKVPTGVMRLEHQWQILELPAKSEPVEDTIIPAEIELATLRKSIAEARAKLPVPQSKYQRVAKEPPKPKPKPKKKVPRGVPRKARR